MIGDRESGGIEIFMFLTQRGAEVRAENAEKRRKERI